MTLIGPVNAITRRPARVIPQMDLSNKVRMLYQATVTTSSSSVQAPNVPKPIRYSIGPGFRFVSCLPRSNDTGSYRPTTTSPQRFEEPYRRGREQGDAQNLPLGFWPVARRFLAPPILGSGSSRGQEPFTTTRRHAWTRGFSIQFCETSLHEFDQVLHT